MASMFGSAEEGSLWEMLQTKSLIKAPVQITIPSTAGICVRVHACTRECVCLKGLRVDHGRFSLFQVVLEQMKVFDGCDELQMKQKYVDVRSEIRRWGKDTPCFLYCTFL